MSTKLTSEEVADLIATLKTGATVTFKPYQCKAIYDHCTALEEELKAAQERADGYARLTESAENQAEGLQAEIDSHQCLPKKVRDDAINDFRAQLVEAVRAEFDTCGKCGEPLPRLIQLISAFEPK